MGSNYHIMRNDLKKHHTGWCIAAGESFAKDYLSQGDFYIYYTKDEHGNYEVPRIAIRMRGHDRIEEIRGILPNQNMEPTLFPILSEKLKEFPDKDTYEKRMCDMETLTKIDKKINDGVKLTRDEIIFLFEIKDAIQGFGWKKDPRVNELQQKVLDQDDIGLAFKKPELIDDFSDFKRSTLFILINDKYCLVRDVIPAGDYEFYAVVLDKDCSLPEAYFDRLYRYGKRYAYEANTLTQKVKRDVRKDFMHRFGYKSEEIALSFNEITDKTKCIYIKDKFPILLGEKFKKFYKMFVKEKNQYLTSDEIKTIYFNPPSDELRDYYNYITKVKRDAKFDLSHYLNCDESEIALSSAEVTLDTICLFINGKWSVEYMNARGLYDKIASNCDLVPSERKFLSFSYLERRKFPLTSIKSDMCMELYKKQGGLLADLYKCGLSNVANEPDDYKKRNIKVYNGDLIYGETEVPDGYTNLAHVLGNCDFSSLTSAQGLRGLKTVDGELHLENLRDIGNMNQRISVEKLFLSEAILNENITKISFGTIFSDWILTHFDYQTDDVAAFGIIQSTFSGKSKYAEKALKKVENKQLIEPSYDGKLESESELDTYYVDSDVDKDYTELVDELISFYIENDYWPRKDYGATEKEIDLADFAQKVVKREISLPIELEEKLVDVDSNFFDLYVYY